ncbi:MAG TPA: hypothetical protein VM030_07050 [Acidimicrobiales bacterium]|nr:hypothetical protein [Acidimicrobiales bacterium]
MRGWSRAMVAGVLVAAATVTGGLTGFVLALPWLAAGRDGAAPGVVAGMLALAAVADIAATARGRPQPWAVRRQVPREWGRIFPPAGAALLYGARLGVGPLTILSTWLWWAAVVGAAGLGPGPSALVGAGFGMVRTLLMIAVAAGADVDMPGRMAAVRGADTAVAGIVAAAAAALAVAVVASG